MTCHMTIYDLVTLRPMTYYLKLILRFIIYSLVYQIGRYVKYYIICYSKFNFLSSVSNITFIIFILEITNIKKNYHEQIVSEKSLFLEPLRLPSISQWFALAMTRDPFPLLYISSFRKNSINIYIYIHKKIK